MIIIESAIFPGHICILLLLVELCVKCEPCQSENQGIHLTITQLFNVNVHISASVQTAV